MDPLSGRLADLDRRARRLEHRPRRQPAEPAPAPAGASAAPPPATSPSAAAPTTVATVVVTDTEGRATWSLAGLLDLSVRIVPAVPVAADGSGGGSGERDDSRAAEEMAEEVAVPVPVAAGQERPSTAAPAARPDLQAVPVPAAGGEPSPTGSPPVVAATVEAPTDDVYVAVLEESTARHVRVRVVALSAGTVRPAAGVRVHLTATVPLRQPTGRHT